MILASDLRIGNWVYNYKESLVKIMEWSSNGAYLLEDRKAYGIKTSNPIEFTNEWLDRFGFEKRDNSNWWHKGNFTYWQDQNTWYWRMEPIHPDLTMYVHQIQNLYHALTGEEL
jgi:hypothetical protein